MHGNGEPGGNKPALILLLLAKIEFCFSIIHDSQYAYLSYLSFSAGTVIIPILSNPAWWMSAMAEVTTP